MGNIWLTVSMHQYVRQQRQDGIDNGPRKVRAISFLSCIFWVRFVKRTPPPLLLKSKFRLSSRPG